MAAKPVGVVAAIKRGSIVFLILISAHVFAQTTDNPKKKPPVSLELLYNFYHQDGNNSAVTGGIGTEKLTYNSPNIVVHIPADSVSGFTVKAGVDVYSSASQDNIDFNVSSASAQDARTHISVGYATENPDKETSYSAHVSGSVESDYLSFGVGGNFSKGWYNGNSVLQLGAQLYFDDCRWGWLDGERGTQLQLIYPQELRYKEWFDIYKRYSTTLNIGFNQLLTSRLSIGLYADGVWQTGLLSTTFHRVYFTDQTTARVENLPQNRFKIPLALRVNYFALKRVLLRGYYRFYSDNWGINAHTLELESSIKLRTFFSIMPFYRFYVQQGAYWFQPYGEHFSSSTYYTSDYDLSPFTAHQFGVGINWKPASGLWVAPNGYGWQGMQVRLGTYLRSTGLNALFLSTVFFIGTN